MIIKSYEEKKIDLDKQKMHLLYGENQGHIDDLIQKIFKVNFNENIFKYDEQEILKNENIIFNIIKTKSFFDDKKLIIINRTTDKIFKIIEQISQTDLKDVNLVLVSNILDKKSKLRNFFEKEDQIVCVPFYKDNDQSLINIISNFCQNKKINISQQNINLIIQKTNGSRQSIKNELEKIESYSLSKKSISEEDILKIVNVTENHDISSLVDYCLTKDKRKIVEILNDNNFMLDEVIKIIRVFLAKSKRLQILITEAEKINSIDRAIAEHKPPIFWKDKNIVKKQLQIWKKNNIIELIYKINSIELITKKNSLNSLNILLDFIFSETTLKIQ